jgi:4-diphosphocytidyl-2-C-methyl-D-erythritol kinase
MPWTCRCPAKLNLFLAVGPKDDRDWHPLRTVFQAIDLWDTVTVELADSDELISNVDYLPADNTLTRALAAYRRQQPIPPLAIVLDKTIPAQSGLGGGSSDAAGLLRVLQEISSQPLEHAELLELALSIGADVPFFLIGGRASAEGYGEKILPLPDPPERHYLVVKPEVDCPTGAMFKALDELDYPWKDFPVWSRPPYPWADDSYNDFERVMPEMCAEHIVRLQEYGALTAGLTGSGSAVYGEFEVRSQALTARELLADTPEENVWICRSLGREESLALELR